VAAYPIRAQRSPRALANEKFGKLERREQADENGGELPVAAVAIPNDGIGARTVSMTNVRG